MEEASKQVTHRARKLVRELISLLYYRTCDHCLQRVLREAHLALLQQIVNGFEGPRIASEDSWSRNALCLTVSRFFPI